MLAGLQQAASPYADWFFGGPDDARTTLRAWLARPSSEVFAGRAVLLPGPEAVGGFIAMGGAELSRCRQADAVATLGQAGPGRRAIAERMKLSRELFPPVAPDDFYLSKIWVSPEAQGAGHGADLLRRYLALGAEEGFSRFRLDVWSGNHRAIRLYRSMGFETLSESVSRGAAMSYTSMIAEAKASDTPHWARL